MSLNKQRTLKSMAMTPAFEARFTAVNGVIVPSKISPGGQAYTKNPWRVEKSTWVKKAINTCTICGKDCKDKRGLRNHFVACVDRNGNPLGACWDDSLKLNEAANKRSDSLQIKLFFSY